MLIGIVGTNGAGKGCALSFLAKHGLLTITLSDLVREEARLTGRSLDRDTLREIADGIRTREGPDAMMRRALERAGDRSCAFDSIRNAAEARLLKSLGGLLILVDAAPEIRFQRHLARSRETGRPPDGDTLEEFLAMERKESSQDPSRLHIWDAMALADASLRNDGTPADLERDLLSLLEQHGLTLARES